MMKTFLTSIAAVLAFAATAIAPAQAATWTITNGTMNAGSFGIGATFSGTVDFDATGVTAWNIAVYHSNGQFSNIFQTSNGSVNASDGSPSFVGTESGSTSILDLANLSLNSNGPITLTGSQTFCGGLPANSRFCSTSRTITGGTATLTVPLAGAVPEPAGWALMIGGFGLVGAAMRRRRTIIRFA